MIYVHSLIWELYNGVITCELTGSGDSKAIHRDELKGTAGSKYANMTSKKAAEDSTIARKNDWLPGLQENNIRR